ncbi:MAG: VacJ family lipoprotein [Victivallaceae bacterium]|nr:VacJ family lipoprotein [Victivallaceae bacterium]
MKRRLIFAFFIALLCGCSGARPPEDCPAVYTMSTELGGSDPLEPFNRSMYVVNDVLLRWGYRPVGYAWGSIFPVWALDRFNCFTDNIGFPPRMLSSFFQARFSEGGIEFLRFLTNTTLGGAGFFEVADPWFELKRQDEDFGQAFASWGIGPGCYLYLPVYGPSNVRDAVGAVFDGALDPKSYIYGGQAFTAVNRIAVNYEMFDRLYRSQSDGYELMRDLMLQRRNLQLNDRVDFKFPESAPSGGAETVTPAVFTRGDLVPVGDGFTGNADLDTLRSLFFVERRRTVWPHLSFWNSDFSRNGTVRSLQLLSGRPALDYKFYPAPDGFDRSAPLVFVFAGLGGHYSADNATGMAQLINSRGYPVAVFSNVFHPDFLTAAEPGFCAGYTPYDAVLLTGAVNRAIMDLRLAGETPSGVILSGYSHGGLLALFIAARNRDMLRLPLAGVTAVNPPVEPLAAVREIDRKFKAAEAWDKATALNRAAAAIRAYMGADRAAAFSSVDPDSARAFIGLSFRLTLRDAIMIRHRFAGIAALDPGYKWGDRYALYLAVNRLDFDWYAENVLLDYYRSSYGDRSLELDELRRGASMRAVADGLKADKNIRVIHSADDFLLSAADAEFLESVFGDRLTVFSGGGHLGEMASPGFAAALLDGFPPVAEQVK